MNADGPIRFAQRSSPLRPIQGNGGMVALKAFQFQLRGLQTLFQLFHPFVKTNSRRIGSITLYSYRTLFSSGVHTFILSVLFRLIASKGSCVESVTLQKKT